MRAIVPAALAAAGVLAGCAGLNTLQFSSEADPFPADYQELAARAVEGREVAGGQVLRVSYPQTTLGESAFTPKRWYVCVRGLQPRGRPSVPDTWDRLEAMLDPPAGIYDVILVLRPSVEPTVIDGFDTDLCADVRFEALAQPA